MRATIRYDCVLPIVRWNYHSEEYRDPAPIKSREKDGADIFPFHGSFFEPPRRSAFGYAACNAASSTLTDTMVEMPDSCWVTP